MGKKQDIQNLMKQNQDLNNKVAYLGSQIQEQTNAINNTNPMTFISPIYTSYLKMFTARDIIERVSRFVWLNLPSNINADLPERLMSQFGMICAFELPGDILQFANFATTGRLNPNGILDEIRPIDYAGQMYQTHYSVVKREGQKANEGTKIAVLVSDYCPISYNAVSQTSRTILNGETTLKSMASTMARIENNKLISTKKIDIIVENQDQVRVATQQAMQQVSADLPFNIWVKKVVGGEISHNNYNLDTQDLWQCLQSENTLREQFNGTSQGDVFEKKERKITAEVGQSSSSNLVIEDGYKQRLFAINLMRKYFMSCAELDIDTPLIENNRKEELKSLIYENYTPKYENENNGEEDVTDTDNIPI